MAVWGREAALFLQRWSTGQTPAMALCRRLLGEQAVLRWDTELLGAHQEAEQHPDLVPQMLEVFPPGLEVGVLQLAMVVTVALTISLTPALLPPATLPLSDRACTLLSPLALHSLQEVLLATSTCLQSFPQPSCPRHKATPTPEQLKVSRITLLRPSQNQRLICWELSAHKRKMMMMMTTTSLSSTYCIPRALPHIRLSTTPSRPRSPLPKLLLKPEMVLKDCPMT